MSLETKRIKELFGYARTLTKEQGVGVMAGRAVGFFKRRFFGKKARYLPSKQTLEAQRADAAARADGWPTISILTPCTTHRRSFCSNSWTACRPRPRRTGSWFW